MLLEFLCEDLAHSLQGKKAEEINEFFGLVADFSTVFSSLCYARGYAFDSLIDAAIRRRKSRYSAMSNWRPILPTNPSPEMTTMKRSLDERFFGSKT